MKFTDEAWLDYLYWQTQDKKSLDTVDANLIAAGGAGASVTLGVSF